MLLGPGQGTLLLCAVFSSDKRTCCQQREGLHMLLGPSQGSVLLCAQQVELVAS